MARKATPNVMDELLGNKGPAEEAPASEPAKKPKATRKRKTPPKPKATPKVEKVVQEAVTPSSADSDGKNDSEVESTVEMPKDKMTIYLDPKVNDELEMLRLQLRKIIRPGRLHNISKSAVTEAALALMLRDFEENGEKAQIVEAIAKRESLSVYHKG